MDYKKAVLIALIRKHYNRLKNGTQDSVKRISIKPTAVLKDYGENHADYYEKKNFDDSVSKLVSLGFVDSVFIRHGSDIESIILNKGCIRDIEKYLEINYEIKSRSAKIEDIMSLTQSFYNNTGGIVDYYCDDIISQSTKINVEEIDIKRYKDILKLLCFLESNKYDLYPREISQICFADTKYIEDNHLFDIVSKIARGFFNQPVRDEKERIDTILSCFHVIIKEQLVTIRGDFDIWINENKISGKWLNGGITLSSVDFKNITNIKINTSHFMTIENETSFLRFNDPAYVTMYLGGYASRFQIQFINLIYSFNKEILYFHFGDIDVGGFRILQNLNSLVSCSFNVFCMDNSVLDNELFSAYFKRLTEKDKSALLNETTNLKEKFPVLDRIEKEERKLEQEIVSLDLMNHALIYSMFKDGK